MAVADYGSINRWYIAADTEMVCWEVAPSDQCWNEGSRSTWHSSFAEAHAAYLDAVTCEKRTPFTYYTEPRCTRARGHEGMCRFPSKNPEEAPLRVNPK